MLRGRMRSTRAAALALLIALVFAPSIASARSVRLGFGASYWLARTGVFDLNLAVGAPITSAISVGGRFGGLVTSGSGPRVGLPIDLFVHAGLGDRAYVEVLGGPWIFFEGDTVRAHVAIGFGFESGSISFGPEIGYLEPDAILGAKLAFRL